MVASLLPSGQPAEAVPALPLRLEEERWRADFSRSLELGVGLRFEHVSSGLWIDLRLKGFPKRAPRLSDHGAEFRLPEGMAVRYVTEPDRVKEIITLARPEPSELRFRLLAPGLVPRKRAREIVLSSPGTPIVFRLAPIEAYDARGREIPAVMVLEGRDVVIRLDEQALATATAPITIDPTIEGVPEGETAYPEARKLFRTSDGRLILFYARRDENWDDQLAYRVSSDDGQTWASEVRIGDPRNSLWHIAASQTADGGFVLVYKLYHPEDDRGEVAFRRLTPRPDAGWDVSAERSVVADTGGALAYATIVDLGAGPVGRRLAVGYSREDALLKRRDYVVSFSEDSGETWGLPTPCRVSLNTDLFEGIVAVQGQRLHCITSRFGQGLQWSEWTGVGWTPGAPMLVGRYALELPSTTVGEDGTLHLTVEEGEQGYTAENDISYTSLPPTAGAWSPKVSVGVGEAPVISTTGKSLFIYTEEELSYKEQWIRPYVATDGQTWHQGTPIGGRPFEHVLDRNTTWDIRPKTRDMLFALRDGSGSDFGNRVGIAVVPHRLDAPSESVSFSFVAPTPDTAGDPYPDVVLSDVPWGYWRLGETSGTTATDSSGNGRHGSYTGGVTLGVDGTTPDGDKAASFDGMNDHVAPSALLNSGVVTVEAWIKIDAAPSTPRNIVSFQNGLGSGVTDKRLILGNDGKIRFHVWDGMNRYAVSTVSVPTGVWTHVAGVADGTTAKVYQNGVEVGSVSAGQSYAAYTVPNMFVAAGGPHADGTMGYFPGSIDEVTVYDSALSASRIQAHRDAGVSAQGQVRRIELWVGSNNAPTYRIGLQSDAGGVPSGRWLDEVRVGDLVVSGAYTDRALGTSSSEWSTVFQIPDTTLTAGDRYHVVVQPNPTALESPPSATRWAVVDAVETDPGGEGQFRVLDGVAGTWTVAPGEVPLFRLEAPQGDTVIEQGARPIGSEPVTEYSVPGETFVAPTNLAPTEARVYLRKVGNPTGAVTLRLLGVENDELWSGSGVPEDTGWFRVPVSGLTLVGGQRYRLLVDGRNRDLDNYWEAPTAGTFWDDASSWEGSEATLVTAPDRPGYNDRSAEAADGQGALWNLITLFNSAVADELYLGDGAPFDFAVLVRGWPDPSNTVPVDWSYWNGSAWVALSTQGALGDLWQGDIRFGPPPDWQRTAVDGRDAYWIRGRSSVAPRPIVARRITSIRNVGQPTAASSGGSTIPLAWSRGNEPSGVDFALYDAMPPTLHSRMPRPDRNTLDLRPVVSVRTEDEGSGVDLTRVTLKLDGDTVQPTFEGSTGTAAIRYPPTDNLGLGVHTAQAIVLDAAGNLSETSWRFNVTAMSAKLVEASISPIELVFGPGDDEVVFASTPVVLESGALTLSDSIGIGSGEVALDMDFSSAAVTFANGATVETVPLQNATTTGTTVPYSLLAPTSDTIEFVVPSQEVSAASLVAQVPAAFRNTGGTARLEMAHGGVAVGWSYPDPLPIDLDCGGSGCRVEGDITCEVDSTEGVGGCNGAFVSVWIRAAGQSRIVGRTATILDNPTSSDAPNPNPGLVTNDDGCARSRGISCENLLFERWKAQRQESYWSTGQGLGVGPLMSAFGHHYYFAVTGAGEQPIIAAWQQSDVSPGSAPCIDGGALSIHARLIEFQNWIEVAAGGWAPSGLKATTTGHNPDAQGLEFVQLARAHPSGGGNAYAVGSQTDVSETRDSATDQPLGTFSASPVEDLRVWNAWRPFSNSEMGQQAHVEISTGTEFTGPSTATFGFRTGIAFEFIYDNGECLA